MSNLKIKRVYRNYLEWEEIKYNMWGSVDNTEASLNEAIKFTGNHILYGEYMKKVVLEWTVSCENALTDNTINKKAWVGHAAVALALQIPEDITRKAWSFLSDEQQLLANIQAERAVRIWENNYRKNKNICENVDEQVLSLWDT